MNILAVEIGRCPPVHMARIRCVNHSLSAGLPPLLSPHLSPPLILLSQVYYIPLSFQSSLLILKRFNVQPEVVKSNQYLVCETS